MSSLRHRCFTAIAAGNGDVLALPLLLGETRRRISDAVHGLKRDGKIERMACCCYRVAAGAQLEGDGRGKSIGSAIGRAQAPRRCGSLNRLSGEEG